MIEPNLLPKDDGTSEEEKIYINGKNQIIDMFQIMKPAERAHLIKLVCNRNASRGLELAIQGIQFDHIESLDDSELGVLYQRIPASVLGIAIRGLDEEFQRKTLKCAPRGYAEEAFQALTKDLPRAEKLVVRARGKILETLVDLYKDGKLSFV